MLSGELEVVDGDYEDGCEGRQGEACVNDEVEYLGDDSEERGQDGACFLESDVLDDVGTD